MQTKLFIKAVLSTALIAGALTSCAAESTAQAAADESAIISMATYQIRTTKCELSELSFGDADIAIANSTTPVIYVRAAGHAKVEGAGIMEVSYDNQTWERISTKYIDNEGCDFVDGLVSSEAKRREPAYDEEGDIAWYALTFENQCQNSTKNKIGEFYYRQKNSNSDSRNMWKVYSNCTEL